MDIPRTDGRKRTLTRWAVGALVVAVLAAAGWGMTRLKPAAPSVDPATLWHGTVQRGTMILQVRGTGTLVPEEVLIIPATTDGRITRILVRPGSVVTPNTVVAEMVNDELELAATDLDWQIKAAEATYRDLKVRLETQRLEQLSRTAQVRADLSKAKLTADRDRQLWKNGLTADITARLSQNAADELNDRAVVEQKRLEILSESTDAQLAAQDVAVQKLKAARDLKRKQLGQLRVQAGTEGVLQEMAVEVGQRITAGTKIAKVVQPSHLKATIKVPETQIKDVALGQRVDIDTRSGMIRGVVSRIEPAAVQGTISVDVRLEGMLPSGARPDLSVDGIVEIQRLDNVLSLNRPVNATPDTTMSMFKYTADGKEAVRVPVRVGRVSVNQIEIQQGLSAGDQVVLSDLTAITADRIRVQ